MKTCTLSTYISLQFHRVLFYNQLHWVSLIRLRKRHFFKTEQVVRLGAAVFLAQKRTKNDLWINWNITLSSGDWEQAGLAERISKGWGCCWCNSLVRGSWNGHPKTQTVQTADCADRADWVIFSPFFVISYIY